jgi:hypothetical protein
MHFVLVWGKGLTNQRRAMMLQDAHERENYSAQALGNGMLNQCHDGPDELLFQTVWSGRYGQPSRVPLLWTSEFRRASSEKWHQPR